VGSPGRQTMLPALSPRGECAFFTIRLRFCRDVLCGVGASRCADMFEQGKKNDACIIFIAEIDAVVAARGRRHSAAAMYDSERADLEPIACRDGWLRDE